MHRALRVVDGRTNTLLLMSQAWAGGLLGLVDGPGELVGKYQGSARARNALKATPAIKTWLHMEGNIKTLGSANRGPK